MPLTDNEGAGQAETQSLPLVKKVLRLNSLEPQAFSLVLTEFKGNPPLLDGDAAVEDEETGFRVKLT